MLRKVLVANRGEIAVRVIRACREMGVDAVAVFSEADRCALHVRSADTAVAIGPPPAVESYLDANRLIEAALSTGCDALHPGYGFLAENASFARSVAEAGLVFVGPSPEAMAAMGDKTSARERLAQADIPLIPGSSGLTDATVARAEAERIGYPVVIKAAAGGGGRGMRVVHAAGDMESAFRAARGEAGQAFGDDRVYLERFLETPRHVEIQILADGFGSVISLGERECSVQRRHQKLIEESPSPAVDEDLRRRMGRVAVRVAKAAEYQGAGTVEFLLDGGDFFFLEMNTRIQVEHTVTELVADVDLVQEQLRIAAGLPLRAEAVDGSLHGHAIECRISGEDPYNGFLPSTGRIDRLRLPAGPGVRWDGGIVEGDEIGLHYDSLLGKLIVHAPNRSEAIARMQRALRELSIRGISTTQPFHVSVMDEPDFTAGEVSIRYVQDHPELTDGEAEVWERDAAVLAAVLLEAEECAPNRGVSREWVDPLSRGRRSAWRERFSPR